MKTLPLKSRLAQSLKARKRAVQAGLKWPSGVHPPARCEGQGCPIHHPSEHHMADWPLHWRADTFVMERTCPHGIGHPDPDHLAYVKRVEAKHKLDCAWHWNGPCSCGAATSKASLQSANTQAIHGCDGCCNPVTRGVYE